MIKSLLGGADGNIVTPNQFAKQLVFYKGVNAYYYNDDDMTEREKQLITDAVRKQLDRVAKFLGGYDSLYDVKEN